MFYEPRSRDRQLLPHDPVKAIVAPRPIGWISTRALDGRVNLAPYSFFNAFSAAPPIVGFSSDGLKNSASFARETGEFVFNLASFELLQAVSKTSAPAAARKQRVRTCRPDHGAVQPRQGAQGGRTPTLRSSAKSPTSCS